MTYFYISFFMLSSKSGTCFSPWQRVSAQTSHILSAQKPPLSLSLGSHNLLSSELSSTSRTPMSPKGSHSTYDLLGLRGTQHLSSRPCPELPFLSRGLPASLCLGLHCPLQHPFQPQTSRPQSVSLTLCGASEPFPLFPTPVAILIAQNLTFLSILRHPSVYPAARETFFQKCLWLSLLLLIPHRSGLQIFNPVQSDVASFLQSNSL